MPKVLREFSSKVRKRELKDHVRSSQLIPQHYIKHDEDVKSDVDDQSSDSDDDAVPTSIQLQSTTQMSCLLPVVNLLEKYNFKYELMPDSHRKHNSFFLQDKQMNSFFNYYPEYICIDVLCEIIELGHSLFLFISIDSNGHCEIVSVGLIKTGSLQGLTWLCEVFKKHNPNWRKTQFISSDRDLDNVEIIKNAFPGKFVLISLFHSIRALKKDLSNLEHVSSEDISKTIQIFEHMIYTCNESGYSELLKQIKQMPSAIATLFRKSWHAKRELWTLGLQFNSKTILRAFNHFLLLLRRKVRPLISTESSVENIVKRLYSALIKSRKERFHKFTSLFYSTSVPQCSKLNPSQKYSKVLTCYAAELVIEQLNLSDDVKNLQKVSPGKYSIYGSDVLATINICSCNFYKLLALPCCHIFAIRNHLSLPLFVEALCSSRWLVLTYRNTYLDLQDTYLSEIRSCESEVIDFGDRFHRFFEMSSELWPVLLESSDVISQERIQVLQDLLKAWRNGLKVAVKVPERQHVPESKNEIPVDAPSDYWKEIYGISLKDIVDSDNDFSSVSLCSENSDELL